MGSLLIAIVLWVGFSYVGDELKKMNAYLREFLNKK